MGRIPFLGWLAINTALAYAIFNPTGYSLAGLLMTEGTSVPLRILLTLSAGALIVLLAAAGWRSIGLAGAALVCALWGAVLWLASDGGVFDARSATAWLWLAPFMVASILTIGQRGGAIWRRYTGQVVVDTD